MARATPPSGRRTWLPGIVSVLLLLVALPLFAYLLLGILAPLLFAAAANSSNPYSVEFEFDRDRLDELVAWVHGSERCPGEVELPEDLAHLSLHGAVNCGTETVFLPQWAGIPDDAGGFWYSPGRSPAGFDMWGMICEDPVDLGDGWWSCGMAV